jgi:CMP-N,N'-diacetyllegionaminic acid synthase
MTSRIVGLIPARAGSKRVPNKNVLQLQGHPLLAYTISAALDSGVFEKVIVSTDSDEYAQIALHYGAEVPFLRPNSLAQDSSADIGWVAHALENLALIGYEFEIFSILRPTSPFRNASTIRRAYEEFSSRTDIDSIRAVELCSQHPGKMWRIKGDHLVPLLSVQPDGLDWFSSPTQSLPEVWVQNASLEIAFSRCVLESESISGSRIAPFKTVFPEGIDINSEFDFAKAKMVVDEGLFSLPEVRVDPYRF